MKYAVVSVYNTFDHDHGDPELLGPYDDAEKRDADLRKRFEDDCEEHTITISLLEIQDGKIIMTGGFIAELDESWSGDIVEDSEGDFWEVDSE